MRLGDVAAVGLVGLVLAAAFAVAAAQAPPGAPGPGARPDRAEATRQFLGLGVEPDRAAAARGAPIFAANCAYLPRGPGARRRGADLSSRTWCWAMITARSWRPSSRRDGRKRACRRLRTCRPTSSATWRSSSTSRSRRSPTGARTSCRTSSWAMPSAGRPTSRRIARAAIRWPATWPLHRREVPLARRAAAQLGLAFAGGRRRRARETATVVTPAGTSADAVQISDFRVTVVDPKGETHVIERSPKVEVEVKDPRAPHEAMLAHLSDDDMHDVTAYLDAQK